MQVVAGGIPSVIYAKLLLACVLFVSSSYRAKRRNRTFTFVTALHTTQLPTEEGRPSTYNAGVPTVQNNVSASTL
jgi:hypothetical protein